MKKFAALLVGIAICTPSFADNSFAPLLNTVKLQLTSEQWVTTTTALVNVAINASVTDKNIETLQNAVLQKLDQLSKEGEWHTLSFDRQQDKSGLESIQIMAQARLPQSALANLRDKAKAISKPGETYSIDSVQFTPSEDEVRKANEALRKNIYNQAKTELDTLNQQYPSQKYYLHDVEFISFARIEMPAPRAEMYMSVAGNVAAKAATPLNVGNKVSLQANVVLAAMPDILMQKLAEKK